MWKSRVARKAKKTKNTLTRQRSYTLSPEHNCRQVRNQDFGRIKQHSIQVGSIQSFANRDSYIKNALTTRPRRLSELDSETPSSQSQNHHVSVVSQVRFTDNSLERFRPQRGQRPQRLRWLSKNRDSPYMTQYKSTQGMSSMPHCPVSQKLIHSAQQTEDVIKLGKTWKDEKADVSAGSGPSRWSW